MPIKKTVMNKTDIYGIETCSYVYRDVASNYRVQKLFINGAKLKSHKSRIITNCKIKK